MTARAWGRLPSGSSQQVRACRGEVEDPATPRDLTAPYGSVGFVINCPVHAMDPQDRRVAGVAAVA